MENENPKSKKRPTRKRPHQVTIRMSTEEFARYQHKLAISCLTANSYGIKCLLNKPIIQRTVEEMQALISAQKALSGIGNNINQLARFCNTSGDSPQGVELNRLTMEVQNVWQLLKQVKGARLSAEQ
jgi:hypothetical protein